MYLSRKQFFLLILPFMISLLVYYFNKELVDNAHYLFPTYKKYLNKDLDVKTNAYFQIESKYKSLQKIKNKSLLRKKNAKWATDNLFYKKQEGARVASVKSASEKTYTYKLQALFPDDKTAIINNLIVKVGSKVDNTTVVTKITNYSVQIKTNKGLKWLSLFQ